MNYRLGVIGVGNMAKAIIGGIQKSHKCISQIFLFDKSSQQYSELLSATNAHIPYTTTSKIQEVIENSDVILLSVKPQNFPEILEEISSTDCYRNKLYISIAAGIDSSLISKALNGTDVIRVLPNLPITIGNGLSLICKNDNIDSEKFDLVRSLFDASGSTIIINETEMNRYIGVTSSSPAYVFKFIDDIYKGAIEQGLSSEDLLDAICDVFIGSALLIKQTKISPEELISRVCSKGGTTEQAMMKLDQGNVTNVICQAMQACTKRADELGNINK